MSPQRHLRAWNIPPPSCLLDYHFLVTNFLNDFSPNSVEIWKHSCYYISLIVDVLRSGSQQCSHNPKCDRSSHIFIHLKFSILLNLTINEQRELTIVSLRHRVTKRRRPKAHFRLILPTPASLRVECLRRGQLVPRDGQNTHTTKRQPSPSSPIHPSIPTRLPTSYPDHTHAHVTTNPHAHTTHQSSATQSCPQIALLLTSIAQDPHDSRTNHVGSSIVSRTRRM